MLFVTGITTTIFQELRDQLPMSEEIAHINVKALPDRSTFESVGDRPRLFLAAGLLRPKQILDQSGCEILEGLNVNLISTMRICELALEACDDVRICVIGTESALRGSFDQIYAASKAGLHQYIESKNLRPNQQIVGIAPTCIEDAGMTWRRTDTANLDSKRAAHPKRRFLTAKEVATLAHFLLYVDLGYISNTVIRMDGRPR